jgi:hypothetical protein
MWKELQAIFGLGEVAVVPDRIVHEGFLFKESQFLKVWRRRWCVLTSEYLCTFNVGDDGPSSDRDYRKPTEVIRLSECESVMSADVTGTENSLYVVTPSRGFFLVAGSADEKATWMSAILNCCLPLLVFSGIQHSLLMFTITEDEEAVELGKIGSELPDRASALKDVVKPRRVSRNPLASLPFWLCLLAEIFSTQPENSRTGIRRGVKALGAGIAANHHAACLRRVQDD